MNIYQLDVRPRHRRYVFLVGSTIEYDNLYWLILKNSLFGAVDTIRLFLWKMV